MIANECKSQKAHETLADLFDEIVTEIQAGRTVDLDRIARDYPQWAVELNGLVPAIRAMVELESSTQTPVAGAIPEASPTPTDGILGDYRLLREVGRGGMGIVYEARQISLSRQVALKMLPLAAVFDDRRIQRFRNEAKMAATLKHPNIVSIFAVGCEQGVHYYAMEFVEGHSLADLVRHVRDDQQPGHATSPASKTTEAIAELSTQWTNDRRGYYRSVARIVAEIADALSHAHREGIVHRDVKPSNILLDKESKAWITDIGLAHMRGDGSLTLTGGVLGTARYMSPEQATGQTLIDQRSDIYSLGVTLYELLTLRPAFAGADYRAALNDVVENDPAPPRKLDDSVPPDLETIVLKAINKSADLRYTTGQEFADDLRRFLSHKPVLARRSGQLMRLRRWTRRNPLLAASLALIFVLLAAVAVGGTATSVHLARSQRIANQKLYIADIAEANLAIEQGDHFRAESILSRHIPETSNSEDQRAFEWNYLWEKCHQGGPKMILNHGLDVYATAYSPNGKMLATAGFSGKVFLWHAETGKPILQNDDPRGWITAMQFTKDSSQLVTAGRGHRVCFWDVGTGRLSDSIPVQASRNIGLSDIALSPDENFVAVGASRVLRVYPREDPGSLSVWNIKTKEKVLEERTFVGHVCVAFSPNGNYLAAASYDGKLRVWRTASSESTTPRRTDASSVSAVTDEASVLRVSTLDANEATSTTGWNPIHSTQAHKAGIFSITFSPDGNMLVTGSGIWNDRFVMGELKLWDTHTWSPRDTIHCGSREIQSLAFTPDGATLAAGSFQGTITLVDVEARTIRADTVAHTNSVWDMTFSPDGRFLLSGSQDNTARLWPIEAFDRTGDVLFFTEGKPANVSFAGEDRVCAVDTKGNLYLFDRKRGLLKTISLGDYWLNSLDVSPDQTLLAVATGNFPPDGTPGRLHVYEVNSCEEAYAADLPGGFIRGLSFSPNNDRVAVAARRTLMVASVQDQTIQRVDELDGWIKAIAYSPDGTRLACESKGDVYFYDAMTYRHLAKVSTDLRSVTEAMTFSNDGRFFFTGGGDRKIKKWDARTYELIAESAEARDFILQLDVSRDGRRLLSGGKEGGVTLWHAELGLPVLVWPVASSWVNGARISPSGEAIVAAGRKRVMFSQGWRGDNLGHFLRWENQRIVCSTNDFVRETNE